MTDETKANMLLMATLLGFVFIFSFFCTHDDGTGTGSNSANPCLRSHTELRWVVDEAGKPKPVNAQICEQHMVGH
jgi:hypothetical protein